MRPDDGSAGARANAAFEAVARTGIPEHARWLEALAAALEAHAPELIALADEETLLGGMRLGGELARTSGQLRFLADVVRDGTYLDVAIDHAGAHPRTPAPDLRRMLVPVGPVAVFAASNFPFAFSVLGGDTAAALAVGGSVVVKAHPGHPRLSRRVHEIGVEALAGTGAPRDLLQLVEGVDAGRALVVDPGIRAVAFTGGARAGRILSDLAAGRPEPVPFYGELGSANPVVVTAAAAETRTEEIAAGLVASYTLGAGQFCTKPGVVLIPAGSDLVRAVAERVAADAGPAAMLSDTAADGYRHDLDRLRAVPGVRRLVDGDTEGRLVAPSLLSVAASALLGERGRILTEEVFGPATLLVEYASDAELRAALDRLPGSLTASLFVGPDDDVEALIAVLLRRAGRLLFDQWPTGVAVAWAQTHGGPWPAATTAETSVGAASLRRFLRPVSWQNAPRELLPAALRDDNPLGVPRRIDGELVLA